MKTDIKALVLAAGKGTRMQDGDLDAPKVMRLACGKPLLWYVLEAISFIDKKDTILIVGYKKESVISVFDEYPYALQEKQLGTGHAVMSATHYIDSHKGAILVCYGDMPAIKAHVYKELVNLHIENGNDCTILTAKSTLDIAFGRIIRGDDGSFMHVIEEKDCTPEQLKITELNTGVYVFNTEKMLKALSNITNSNSQGEYYLTDVPMIMRKSGEKIGLLCKELGDDIIGVNTREHLEKVEKILRRRKAT